MSILIYIDAENGKVKKSAHEVATYARSLATAQNVPLVALAVNVENPEKLGTYGVDKVLTLNDEKLQHFSAKAVAHALQQAAAQEDAKVVVLSASSQAKHIAPLLAIYLKADYAANVISLPENGSIFSVKSHVFSNKAIAIQQLSTPVKLLSIAPNAFGVKENPTNAVVTPFVPTLADTDFDVQVTAVEKGTDKVSLDEAAIVVSGGRGLKGAEHWSIIEELAEVLGAATACSKPVADMGWRPHAEHVGQTGKPIAPNLYIAIGISGAIQHLAGVNGSKIKLVINNDPEAPFFKAADYGVVGDAFSVVPELIKKLKARQ